MAEDGDKHAAITLVSRTTGCDPQVVKAAPIDTPASRRWRLWRFWEVRTLSFPPGSVIVATRGGRATLLRREEGLAPLVAVEPLAITSPEEAIEHVRFFVSLAMPMVTVLDRAEDIPGLVDEARGLCSQHVRPPVCHIAGEGFVAHAWLSERGALLRASFTVKPAGIIGLQLETLAEGVGIHTPLL